MKKSIVLLLALFSMASSVNAKTSCDKLEGEWVNEFGSTLTIKSVEADGKLSGTYVSSTGTSGDAAPMIGWTNSAPPVDGGHNVKVVSFSVNWGSYGSVTSWSGSCSSDDGISNIKTIWNIVRSNSKHAWDHVLTNSTTFVAK